MTDEHTSSPNTLLGEVNWWHCVYWGNLEFLCQDLLGMSPQGPRPDRKYLDTKAHNANHLWDFFREIEMSDGRLALGVSIDDCGALEVAVIETPLMYGDEISDDDFFRLIDDFVLYARSRPIVDSSKREGAELSDDDVEGMMSRNETLQESDFWRSLQTVTVTHHGLPHYLWLESLTHQRER